MPTILIRYTCLRLWYDIHAYDSYTIYAYNSYTIYAYTTLIRYMPTTLIRYMPTILIRYMSTTLIRYMQVVHNSAHYLCLHHVETLSAHFSDQMHDVNHGFFVLFLVKFLKNIIQCDESTSASTASTIECRKRKNGPEVARSQLIYIQTRLW